MLFSWFGCILHNTYPKHKISHYNRLTVFWMHYVPPEACLRKLLSWLMMGMLGREGLFIRFFKDIPTGVLQWLLRLSVIGVVPLTFVGPGPVKSNWRRSAKNEGSVEKTIFPEQASAIYSSHCNWVLEATWRNQVLKLGLVKHSTLHHGWGTGHFYFTYTEKCQSIP